MALPPKLTRDCGTQVEQGTYPWDSISPEGWGSHRQRATKGRAEPEAQLCSGPNQEGKNAQELSHFLLNAACQANGTAGTSSWTNDPRKRDR